VYVRRDRSSLSSGAIFKGGSRRRTLRWVYPAVIMMLGVLALVIWQRPVIQPVALALIGIRNTPTPTINESAHQGDLAFWRGDLSTSIFHYRTAAEIAPENLNIQYELIRMLVYRSFDGSVNSQRDITEAIDRATALLLKYPSNARALAINCLALARAGQSESAAQSCNRALNFDPNNSDAHAFLAQVYYDLGRYTDAAEIGKQALDLAATSIEANTAYGFVQLTSRTPEAAIPYFVKAAEYNKQLEFPYFNLALNAFGVGLRQGDDDLYRLAIDAYDTILSVNKRSVRAYTGLCQVYFVTGERNLARDNCITATELDPEYTSAWRWLGEINYLTTEYESAVSAFEECYKREQNLPVDQRQSECWVFRGLSWVQLGDCRRALPIFTETLNWVRSTTAIERINKGIRICTGRAAFTPTPLPITLTPTFSEPPLDPFGTPVVGTPTSVNPG